MDHTHIIHASDLERYADTRESQALIPELIYLLVKQSVSNLSECRIPYGEDVNQPGWDGLVCAEGVFREFRRFVPEGKPNYPVCYLNSTPEWSRLKAAILRFTRVLSDKNVFT